MKYFKLFHVTRASLLTLLLLNSFTNYATNYIFYGIGDWNQPGQWYPQFPSYAPGDSIIIEGTCFVSSYVNNPGLPMRIAATGNFIVSDNFEMSSSWTLDYGGSITVTGSELTFGSATSNLNQINGQITVNNGSSLRYVGNALQTTIIGSTGNISISGELIYESDGIAITNNGTITINPGGLLQMGPTHGLTNNGTFTNNGWVIFQAIWPGGPCTLQGIFGGSGTYTYQGGSASSLAGTMTFSNFTLK